ncbi:type IV pilus secretin family protein [Malonomonas rubra]|uniref:type IV pilus secretin family protein n=1 Tax=Malonomonas rubra TaxID=57040 RepID=UPI0026F0B5F1|nr:type IV pilus secretin family protein [Malonomonas rubra]
MIERMIGARFVGFKAILATVVVTLLLPAVSCLAESAPNKMVSLSMEKHDGKPAIRIVTENPVGYRYTVYDSIDPVRVVLDFPGMDVAGVQSLSKSDMPPVSKVDVSSYDLTSGKLGRVEVVLSNSSDYDVTINDNEFLLVLTSAVQAAQAEEPKPTVEEPAAAPVATSEVAPTPVVEKPVVAEAVEEVQPANLKNADAINGLEVHGKSVTIEANGHVEIFKYFTLNGPSRLVVDIYDVKADFSKRSFNLTDGFKKTRVGVYKDKIRFVFDATGNVPEYAVTSTGNNVVVSWGAGSSAAEMPAPVTMGSSKSTVTVDAVDFVIEDGYSVLRIKTDGAPAIISPSQKGDIIGFGIKNASISRALRRAIDASSFPSAIRLVTPYTVQVGKNQDVRFAVELKGTAPYTLEQVNGLLELKVQNGSFAEPRPFSPEQVAVDMPASMDLPKTTSGLDMQAEGGEGPGQSDLATASMEDMAMAEGYPSTPKAIGEEAGPNYSGQRISLVFDNADIRNILQLIAEVSELNILAGDGVEGTITLRLIDVPWDQALDLILETKDLGMVRQGNVARILPREAIRTMEESKFTAARTKEKLEDLVTEVIKVSYTDLKNIATPVKGLLTDRGKLTEDARNKQFIISDIPKVIESAKELASILDTPERQVLIEARIVEVSTTASLDLGVSWNILYDQNPAGTQNTIARTGFGGNFVIPPNATTGSVAGIGTGFTWGALGVDTTILDLRLSAAEAAGDGRVVSNPRILTLNGEKAKISQGTMIPYQTVSNDEITTELIEAALALEVTPVINPDNTVILEVKASNSSPGTTVLTGAGSAPSIDKKEAETKMLVRDGDTMVIGGVYVEKEDFSENGVPILMHIPLLGNLFKATRTNKNRAELMIFITPRIIE